MKQRTFTFYLPDGSTHVYVEGEQSAYEGAFVDGAYELREPGVLLVKIFLDNGMVVTYKGVPYSIYQPQEEKRNRHEDEFIGE